MVSVASIVTFAAVAAASLDLTAAAPRIDSGVHRALRKQSTVNLIVKFKDVLQNPLESVKEASFDSRGAKISAVVTALEMNAVAAQTEVTKMLAQESLSTTPLFSSSESLWIDNSMSFRDATIELVEKLAAMGSVAEIREEKVFYLPEVTEVAASNTTATEAGASILATNQWGVDRVRAPQIWATGNTGQGIVVGSIDSGVRGSHEVLRGNFRSSYGWFDPERRAATSYDSNGHGTHTLSSMAGANGYGVAPGATWIACKGCRGRGCPEADLLACGQWMTCPTNTNGQNRDCSKAPHLVSNSLGGPGNDPSYKSVVAAWHAAGIIPIFANGNEGPVCGSAGSPAEYADVIAVGSIDVNNRLAGDSSRGPTLSRPSIVKPDISGPGVDVRGAWLTSDASYAIASGTSMATPHVSGVIALMLKAKPGATYNQIYSAITSTGVRNLAAVSNPCGGIANGVYPNNQYGHGLIDAVAAINKL